MFTDNDGINLTFEVSPASDNHPGYDVAFFYSDPTHDKLPFLTHKHVQREGAITLLQPNLLARLKNEKNQPWSYAMGMISEGQVNKVLGHVLASVSANVRKLREGAIAAGGGNVQSASAPTL